LIRLPKSIHHRAKLKCSLNGRAGVTSEVSAGFRNGAVANIDLNAVCKQTIAPIALPRSHHLAGGLLNPMID
jgi:hypothetical protein